jgi:hypothetical protein
VLPIWSASASRILGTPVMSAACASDGMAKSSSRINPDLIDMDVPRILNLFHGNAIVKRIGCRRHPPFGDPPSTSRDAAFALAKVPIAGARVPTLPWWGWVVCGRSAKWGWGDVVTRDVTPPRLTFAALM